MLRSYLLLTKPGIIAGNLFIAVAGFLLAAGGNFKPGLFMATVAGLGMVIASACIFNNALDRKIDSKMARTKKRLHAWRSVRLPNALLLGSFLLAAGEILLYRYANILSAGLAVLGFVLYVAVYGFFKRQSVYGTLVGSIPGAIPPIVGYTAASGSLDGAALVLFLMMVFWQMPHFFAISIYRFEDYKAAGLPVMPVSRGMRTTKINIIFYAACFVAAAIALGLFGYAGKVYLLIMITLGIRWLFLSISGLRTANNNRWARQMFHFSLVVLTAMSIVIAANYWLP